jgi:hypothetical protein
MYLTIRAHNLLPPNTNTLFLRGQLSTKEQLKPNLQQPDNKNFTQGNNGMARFRIIKNTDTVFLFYLSSSTSAVLQRAGGRRLSMEQRNR